MQWQGYGRYANTAVIESRLCTACYCGVFSSYLHNWLQHGCLLILIWQQLTLINLHPCGLHKCHHKQM